MMSTIKNILQCVFGPRLYKIHNDGPIHKLYTQSGLERWGDHAIMSLMIIAKIGFYTSPLVGYYLYKNDYMETKSIIPFLRKTVTALGIMVTISVSARGYGRATNPQYTEFVKILSQYPKTNNTAVLRRFDFDFSHWPVDFNCQSIEESKGKNYTTASGSKLRTWRDLPVHILGKIVVHTFALKLIYPGSISLLQMTLSNVLLEGRIKLVEVFNGQRYKVRTRDSNNIDCMFVNRREITSNGSILVITSEGNAGFYEIGIMTTPIDAGYSVLGWNHPGFGGSTGKPFPLQEQYAVDAVMQFAIHKLGFAPENIILFGWSIGCYTVAWAAVQYPDIRGIILDATFDDVLSLAQARMPASWNSLVREVIRGHVNLNIAEVLQQYNGPIKLIRRTLDEIICIEEGHLGTNKGNDLLIKILSNRYPDLLGVDQRNLLRNYLAVLGPAKTVFLSKEHPGDAEKNKKVLYLARKYMADLQSTHCTPLPVDLFEVPQDLTLDNNFVLA